MPRVWPCLPCLSSILNKRVESPALIVLSSRGERKDGGTVGLVTKALYSVCARVRARVSLSMLSLTSRSRLTFSRNKGAKLLALVQTAISSFTTEYSS